MWELDLKVYPLNWISLENKFYISLQIHFQKYNKNLFVKLKLCKQHIHERLTLQFWVWLQFTFVLFHTVRQQLRRAHTKVGSYWYSREPGRADITAGTGLLRRGGGVIVSNSVSLLFQLVI